LSEIFEHRFLPGSAGLAVPLFAFSAAGVNTGGTGGLLPALADPVLAGIILGLVGGISFTVSMLVAELRFGHDVAHAKDAILTAPSPHYQPPWHYLTETATNARKSKRKKLTKIQEQR
jgi:Na+/H+ antiporter NhaA